MIRVIRLGRRRTFWVGAASACLLAALIVAIGLVHGHSRSRAGQGLGSHVAPKLAGRVLAAPIGTAAITIDSEGIEFNPAASPASAPSDAMSADGAYSHFEGPGETMAAGTSYAYGTLTWPLADGTYRFRDRPVWGYRFAGCMSGSEPLAGNGATPTASPPPTSCTSWIFLDAATGANLLTTQQE